MSSLRPSASSASASPQAPVLPHARRRDSPPLPKPRSPGESKHSANSHVEATAASPRPSRASALARQRRAREVSSDSEREDDSDGDGDGGASSDGDEAESNSDEEAECKPAAAAAAVSSTAEAKAGVEEAELEIPKNVIGLRRLPAFLSAAECAHLISLGSDHFVRSRVSGAVISDVRTSYSFLLLLHFPSDSIVSAVLQRISELVAGDDHVEMYVVRYEPGQFFGPHRDSHLKGARPCRRASMVVYLNDVDEGGETHFTKLDIRVKPKCGDAIVWNNHADAYTEVYHESQHEGLPRKSGFKYILSVFVQFA